MQLSGAAGLLAGLLVSAVGCGKRIEECNALIGQLNASSGTVQRHTTGLASSPKAAEAALKKLSTSVETETAKIAAVQLSVEELVAFSKRYQTMLADVLASARAMGKAAAALDAVEAAVSKGRDGWMSSTTKLRTACLTARKECKALGDVLTKPPTVSGVDPLADAKKLDEYSAAIGKVKIKNAEVEAAVGSMKSELGSFAEALRKADQATRAVEKAAADMKTTADKEPALINEINSFCQGG